MKIVAEMDVHLPEWCIPYLEYGEDGSLSAEDMAEVDAWVESLHHQGFPSPTYDFEWDSEENGFYHYPEFGLGAGCVLTHVYQFAPD